MSRDDREVVVGLVIVAAIIMGTVVIEYILDPGQYVKDIADNLRSHP